jgi:S-sulfo-L-cysteine synthase (O-acetyl-L-serine-dependent)
MNNSIDKLIGKTRLLKIKRLSKKENTDNNNEIWGKMEGDNPSGSLKDRAALGMILGAEKKRKIHIGDTLIEPTSGNTGIALAMLCAARGYKVKLVMSKHQSVERVQAMEAYGAEVILIETESTKELINYTKELAERNNYLMLDQFSNDDNWLMHYETTGPEIWEDTQGRITHFVAVMGTMGTITGVSKYLKEKNSNIKIIGVQPDEASQRIPGITRWPLNERPSIGAHAQIDKVIDVGLNNAVYMSNMLAKKEGLFCGFTAAAAYIGALEVAKECKNAVIVFIVCDRGDRYLSTNLFKK